MIIASEFSPSHKMVVSPKPALNVVAVYEDYFAGMMVKALLEQLAREFEPQYKIAASLWKFDVLKFPHIGRVAAQDLASANMIVFAADSRSDIPPELAAWFRSWRRRKNGLTCVLLALLHHTADGSLSDSPVALFLRKVAAAAGINFIPNPVYMAEEEIEFDSLHEPLTDWSLIAHRCGGFLGAN